MERDIEKIIRKKIDGVERAPVAWRKESVWSEIEHSLESKPRNRIFYYKAACFILVIGLFLLSGEETGRTVLDSHHSKLFPVQKKSAPIQKETLTIRFEQAGINSIKRKNNPHRSQRDPFQKTEPHTIHTNTVLIPPTLEEDVPSLPDQSPPVASENKIAQAIIPVHAIFGVDEKPVLTSTPKKERKIRLRFFHGDEERSRIIEASEPTNLLARLTKK